MPEPEPDEDWMPCEFFGFRGGFRFWLLLDLLDRLLLLLDLLARIVLSYLSSIYGLLCLCSNRWIGDRLMELSKEPPSIWSTLLLRHSILIGLTIFGDAPRLREAPLLGDVLR